MGSPIENCPLRAAAVTVVKRSEPVYQMMVNMPSMKAASPTRFTMKALLAAVLAECRKK